MLMYHSGCKRVSSSEDAVEMVISDYMGARCDLGCVDSKPIFSHDTLVLGDASPYQV